MFPLQRHLELSFESVNSEVARRIDLDKTWTKPCLIPPDQPGLKQPLRHGVDRAVPTRYGAVRRRVRRQAGDAPVPAGKEEEEVTRQLRQRLSVLLTRDNMAMLGSRIPTLPPATIDGDFDGGDVM